MNFQWQQGNKLRLLENGDEFFPRVFGAIRRAEHIVILETFILFEDDVGNALHRELLTAVQRGVHIEMMVDGYGSPNLSDAFINTLTSAGVRFIYYNPRPLVLGMRTNIFRRLHRKTVVIDAQIAFIGGINFSAEHNTNYGSKAKQDYTVEVKGPVVADITSYLQQAIGSQTIITQEHYWVQHSHCSDVKRPGDAQVLFVYRDNHQHRDDIEKHYLDMLRSAKEDVIIANAYFFPGYRLLSEICNAAKRGVHVRLIVQGVPDMPIVKVGAELLYNYLVDAGVEIYEYCRRPLHSKVAVKDQQWATVGSSNLDPLSLSLNLEANLIIHDRYFNQTLRDNLEYLLARDCERVQDDKLPRRTWWQLTKSMMVFHFLRHFFAIVGWLLSHAPKISQIEPIFRSKIRSKNGDTRLHRS